MSIQVTEKITRKEAENMVTDLLLAKEREIIYGKVLDWSNEDLEEKLERPFTNYEIIS